jgi:hypothetical protein
MNTSIIVKDTKLEEVLRPFNECEKVYLLALLKGYGELESHDIAQTMGGSIDRYLIEPDFAKMREYFLDNGWKDRKEIEREWKDIISSHYTEMMIIAGMREMGKIEKRDAVVIKEATKCALAVKGKQEAKISDSYDELILKKHRAA